MQTFSLVPACKNKLQSSTRSARSPRARSTSRSHSRTHSRTQQPIRPATWRLSSSEAPLLSRWMSFLERRAPDESSLYCLGDWVDLVAQYIGKSEAVDASVTTFLRGTAAFVSKTEQNFAAAHESKIVTLRALRLTLADNSQLADNRAALIATKLLIASEVSISSLTTIDRQLTS